MIQVTKKTSSTRGASITFALLLFLVCAAVGSVVLAAGTAAAGRMSKIAETDQRYYSVTSAAGLLRDVLDGQTVTATRTTTKEETLDQAGTVVNSETSGPSDPTSDSEDISMILQDAALWLMKGEEGPHSRTYSVTARDASGSAVSGVADVVMDESLASDGTLTLTVYNKKKTGDAAASTYKVTLIFLADIHDFTDTKTTEETPTNVGGTVDSVSYQKVVKTTTVETREVTWHLTSIKTENEALN